MSALESKYAVLYVIIDDVKYRINKYFQTALYFTNYSSLLTTNTIPIVMFKKEFHILNQFNIDFHRYNIYMRIRLNKAIDYFGDQRKLNLYRDMTIEFNKLTLSTVLNIRAYHIDTRYTHLYAAYVNTIKDIICFQRSSIYADRKALNLIYKSAKLHNDKQILDFYFHNIRELCVCFNCTDHNL